MAKKIARPGRPSLGVIPTTLRLTPETLARIDQRVGPKRRAHFIRQAIDHELNRKPTSPHPQSPNTKPA